MFDSDNKIRQRGFTLIELLVVIVIIALLAAILFPVFARVKLANIAYAANFIVIADAARADQSPSRGGLYPLDQSAATGLTAAFSGNRFPGGPTEPTTGSQASPSSRHQGGLNVAYADGHAKWVKISSTWQNNDVNQWRRNPTSIP